MTRYIVESLYSHNLNGFWSSHPILPLKTRTDILSRWCVCVFVSQFLSVFLSIHYIYTYNISKTAWIHVMGTLYSDKQFRHQRTHIVPICAAFCSSLLQILAIESDAFRLCALRRTPGQPAISNLQKLHTHTPTHHPVCCLHVNLHIVITRYDVREWSRAILIDVEERLWTLFV